MTFASEHNGQLIIPAYWQSAWNAMYNVMQILGSVVAGHLQDWLGRRAVFLLAVIVAAGGIAINFVASNAAQFLGGKIVTGFAIGLVLTTTQTYVSEIAPLPMRGIALSVNTIMLVSCFTWRIRGVESDRQRYPRTSECSSPSPQRIAE
jgi:MFS family permease